MKRNGTDQGNEESRLAVRHKVELDRARGGGDEDSERTAKWL